MRTLQKRLKEREVWIESAVRAGQLRTPCLIVDTRTLDELLGLWREHLPDVRVFYSVKANNDQQVLCHLVGNNVGFDAASLSELDQLLTLGVVPERIILSNTIKSTECIQAIVRHRIPLVTVDNERDLRAIAREAAGHWRPNVLVRLKVAPTDVQIDLNERFGCTAGEAERLFCIADDLGLKSAGIHFHVGTQCWNLNSYRDAMDAALQLLTRASRDDVNIINIGGGFPDAQTAEKCGGLSAFFRGLASMIRSAQALGYTVMAEPGRVLVADACTAVCKVIGRVFHNGHEWLYLDDGIYGLFSTAYFEKRKFDFIGLLKADEPTAAFVVAGPTCDSLDVIGQANLKPDTGPGDFVLAHCAGAYSISVKSHFNGFGHINTYPFPPLAPTPKATRRFA